MRKSLYILILLLTAGATTSLHAQILDRVKQKAKDKVNQRADEKIDKAMDKTLDEAENAAKNDPDKKAEKEGEKKTEKAEGGSNNAVPPASIKVYQNYDFVPGDKILFEDHFIDDQDGEFPAHWKLSSGQALLNKLTAEPAFFLTEGNYVRVTPRMKTEKYLTEPFTIEFDYYHKPGAYQVLTFLQHIDKACDCETSASVGVGPSEVSYEGSVNFSKAYPAELGGDNFSNKWHHVAIAVKNHQMKVYVDQYRVLVVPDTNDEFFSAGFGGIGAEDNPIIFKNVRIASGGNMNMIGKKFTESKIVTHGINFDIDKASLRPESMGTLNMILQVMKDNPDLNFEIDGHTDNSGAAAHNLSLSQQRAAAVKEQLVKMGVDASRLSTKGFGDTKPISDNNSLEGKANNRRVEFVKI